MSAAERPRAAAAAPDPVADAAVEAVLRRWSPSSTAVRGDLLAAVERLAERGDRACLAFVAATATHPTWVDADLLHAGQRLGLSLAPPIGAVLLLGGLVEVYAVPSIAEVLGQTRRLQAQTWRRMLETGRFIRDIHLPDALAADGEGLRAILRVRLLHSMIRTRLARRGHTAITQQQMAFTLYAHSHVVRRSLERVGVRLTDREARAHQHMWRLIGHAMGVAPRLLAESPHHEAALYRALRQEVVRGDAGGGRDLAARAIETVASRARVPRGLVSTLVHRLVGRDVAARLEVASSRRWSAVLTGGATLARIINGARRTVPLLDRLSAAAGVTFANVVLAADPGGGAPVGAAAACGSFATLSTSRRRGLHPCSARPNP